MRVDGRTRLAALCSCADPTQKNPEKGQRNYIANVVNELAWTIVRLRYGMKAPVGILTDSQTAMARILSYASGASQDPARKCNRLTQISYDHGDISAIQWVPMVYGGTEPQISRQKLQPNTSKAEYKGQPPKP